MQLRRRNKGKMAGSLYKVYVSPKGVQIYSLKEATKQGFSGPKNKVAAAVKKIGSEKAQNVKPEEEK